MSSYIDLLASMSQYPGNMEWADPEPITETLKPVDMLNNEIIPKPFRPWVVDIAYRMQVAVDFCAIALMVVLGAVIGAGCGVTPKRKDDWLVIPNLWGVLIANPGTLKSPAMAEILKPLAHLEAISKQEYDAELVCFEGEKEAHKAQKEGIRSKMLQTANGKKDLSMEELTSQFISLESPKAPLWKRYKTNDATIEKLAELLKDNPRGLLVFKDELSGLLVTWEKDGREPDRAFFLEAWNGQGGITSDRIGRGTVHVDNACISILGGIQPAKILNYVYHATSEHKNDGLIQRFQMMSYPNRLAHKACIDEYPDFIARDKAFEVIKTLANMDFEQYGAIKSKNDSIPYYHFDEQAQEIFYHWLNNIFDKMQTDEPPVILEHLSKYPSLMPSIALIDHLVNIADGEPEGPITAKSAALAVKWCEYLESHMRRVYGLVGDIAQRSAVELAKKLKAGRLQDGFSVRDVYRKGWYLLTKDITNAACNELEEANWIKKNVILIDGQASKIVYTINPKIYLQK